MQVRKTHVDTKGDRFLINGRPTYEGCEGVEGLLYNVRTVNATFDDTLGRTSFWDDDGSYPENGFAAYGVWKSPESATANTDRFIKALPEYRSYGIMGINLNFQGGHPLISKPWIPEGRGSAGRRPNGQRDFLHNSGFLSNGEIDPAYGDRLSRVIEACDTLGMVVILQLFYFGQDTVFPGEEEIKRAVDEAVDFVCERAYTNIIVEIANEVMWGHYHHGILKPNRVAELIVRAKERAEHFHGRRLLVSTSEAALLNEKQWGLHEIDAVFSAGDLVILHGPDELEIEGEPSDVTECRAKVDLIKARPWYQERPLPILFNESSGKRAFELSVKLGVSWGLHSSKYLQTVWPPRWGVWDNEIRWFFERVKELTSRRHAAG